MFCYKCGKELPDGSKFCPGCGAAQLKGEKKNTVSDTNKSTKEGVFQKKVIIGSLASFVATGFGIVAIFFPSVFNLEKKTMDELTITMSSQKDANTLYDFLTKNKNKIVKLDISYSPKKIQDSNYRVKWREDLRDTLIRKNRYQNFPKTVVTYDDVDSNFTNRTLYDVLSGKSLFSVKVSETESYQFGYQDSEAIIYPDFGALVNNIFYCHTMDIYCHQNKLSLNFQRHNHVKYLYNLPDYPYPATVYSNIDDYPHEEGNIQMDETVLFGNKLAFTAKHYESKYTNGVVNIDKGSIGFITDGTDEDLEPYYVIGNIEHSKNLKLVKAFDNGKLVNIFKSAKDMYDALDSSYDFNTTTFVKVKNEKLVSSDKLSENIAGKFVEGADSLTMEDDDPFKLVPNESYSNSFVIEIPYSTKNNTLYTWKSASLKNRYPNVKNNQFNYKDNNEMINLKGVFYVYGENESEVELEVPSAYFHCDLYESITSQFADISSKPCVFQKNIKLEPLSAKDLEQRNY